MPSENARLGRSRHAATPASCGSSACPLWSRAGGGPPSFSVSRIDKPSQDQYQQPLTLSTDVLRPVEALNGRALAGRRRDWDPHVLPTSAISTRLSAPTNPGRSRRRDVSEEWNLFFCAHSTVPPRPRRILSCTYLLDVERGSRSIRPSCDGGSKDLGACRHRECDRARCH